MIGPIILPLSLCKLEGTRSRLYRSQISQPNTRWKALDEIYQIDIPLHRSTRKISANFRQTFCKHLQTFAKKFANFAFLNTIFIAIFADFHENFSDFHRFSRKCRITLQFPAILLIFSEKSGIFGTRKCKKSDSVNHIPSVL